MYAHWEVLEHTGERGQTGQNDISAKSEIYPIIRVPKDEKGNRRTHYSLLVLSFIKLLYYISPNVRLSARISSEMISRLGAWHFTNRVMIAFGNFFRAILLLNPQLGLDSCFPETRCLGLFADRWGSFAHMLGFFADILGALMLMYGFLVYMSYSWVYWEWSDIYIYTWTGFYCGKKKLRL